MVSDSYHEMSKVMTDSIQSTACMYLLYNMMTFHPIPSQLTTPVKSMDQGVAELREKFNPFSSVERASIPSKHKL